MALHLSTESFWSVSVHNFCSVSMTNVQQLYMREFVKKPSSKSCFLSMVQLKAWFGTYQICRLLLKHPWQQYIMDGSRCPCRDVPPSPSTQADPTSYFHLNTAPLLASHAQPAHCVRGRYGVDLVPNHQHVTCLLNGKGLATKKTRSDPSSMLLAR